MGNIIETSVFEEMMEAEEGFAEMVELIHEVDGEVITESVEDVLERELLERENGELRQLEMEAELSVGI
jgi:CO dehydrogenase/acetyl-CoA synthase beta subunit